MTRNWTMACLLFFAAAPIAVRAQEIRCTQIFMNDSESRICGSDGLMALDKQMADLARRVEMHQDGYKSDQRDFRKALKLCKGNEECLTATYQNRITQLHAVVDQLPAPTSEEAAKLDAGAARAQEKWDNQAEARTRWAEEEKAKPQPQVPMPATLEAAAQPPQNEGLQPVEAPVEPETTVAPDPVPTTPQVPVAPITDPSIPWGWWVFWAVVGVGVLWGIKLKFEEAFYRCPRCRRWGAGDVKDERAEFFTAMQTRTLKTTHKNKQYQITGYSEREVREPVTKRRKTEYIECRTCGHEWVQTSVA